MRRALVVLCLSAVLLWAVTPAIPLVSAKANIGVGDYWEYELDQAEFEGVGINGTMKMEVNSVTQRTVASEVVDVFICKLTSTATLSGDFPGMFNITTPVAGTLTVTGNQVRLASNFSLVSQMMTVVMNMNAMGFQIKMAMGIDTSFDPPFDEYIGDNELAVNTIVSGGTHITGSTYVNISMPPLIPGLNSSETIDVPGINTMKIVGSGVSVQTKAGTFDCFKVNLTSIADFNTSYETLYYSDEVGNYVKYEGGDMTGGMLGGGMTLKSYSHGGGASTSTILILGGGIIAIVVIIAVILLLVTRNKGGAAPTQIPPGAPPPPPAQ